MHVCHPWHGVGLWGATGSHLSLRLFLFRLAQHTTICANATNQTLPTPMHQGSWIHSAISGRADVFDYSHICGLGSSVIHRNTPCGHAGSDLWKVLNMIKRAMPVCEAAGEQLQLCLVSLLREEQVGHHADTLFFFPPLVSYPLSPELFSPPRLFKMNMPLALHSLTDSALRSRSRRARSLCREKGEQPCRRGGGGGARCIPLIFLS